MTAPSTPDLASRILAAIDETERVAREAADGDSGRWFVGRKWNVYRAEDETPWDDVEENRLVVYGVMDVQSEHIALNDPAAVLRGCTADRRLVDRHEPEEAVEDRLPGFCKHCGWRWPCPDLRDLAAGYGVTEETRSP